MLDPRIYRMGMVPVVLAVIVLAFSLEDPSEAAAFARAFDGDLLHGPEQIAA